MRCFTLTSTSRRQIDATSPLGRKGAYGRPSPSDSLVRPRLYEPAMALTVPLLLHRLHPKASLYKFAGHAGWGRGAEPKYPASAAVTAPSSSSRHVHRVRKQPRGCATLSAREIGAGPRDSRTAGARRTVPWSQLSAALLYHLGSRNGLLAVWVRFWLSRL